MVYSYNYIIVLYITVCCAQKDLQIEPNLRKLGFLCRDKAEREREGERERERGRTKVRKGREQERESRNRDRGRGRRHTVCDIVCGGNEVVHNVANNTNLFQTEHHRDLGGCGVRRTRGERKKKARNEEPIAKPKQRRKNIEDADREQERGSVPTSQPGQAFHFDGANLLFHRIQICRFVDGLAVNDHLRASNFLLFAFLCSGGEGQESNRGKEQKEKQGMKDDKQKREGE
jgi:hypothetical protein